MNAKQSPAEEMSYFRLSLLSFLKDSHPDKATDHPFIAQRGDAAALAYSDAIKSGADHMTATEVSSQILFEGLHFSPYRTLVTVLWNEFSEEINPDNAETLALELLPRLHAVIGKYKLSDDFGDTSGYELFYTELTGFIQILLEDGLQ